MLVLTRRKNEAIMIGHDIEITVLSIDGEQIKLGINAPKDVEIFRKEVYLAIQGSNREASEAGSQTIDLQQLYSHLPKDSNNLKEGEDK